MTTEQAFPLGMLLVMVGRMRVDHPRIQMLAVMDEAPALPVAEYLTACGVELMWGRSSDEVAAVVRRMQDRIEWIAS